MANRKNLNPEETANLYLMIQEKGLDSVLDETVSTAKHLMERKAKNVIWMQPDNFDELLTKLETINQEQQGVMKEEESKQ